MQTETKSHPEPINDGGPAFPCEGGSGSGLHPAPGMSLRDWFAGQALAGWIANTQSDHRPAVVAHYCYAIADAMLAERAKEGR